VSGMLQGYLSTTQPAESPFLCRIGLNAGLTAARLRRGPWPTIRHGADKSWDVPVEVLIR
jgi:hypothetical protein